MARMKIEGFERHVAQCFTTGTQDQRRAALSLFGAAGVHAALAWARERAEEREEDGYHAILSADVRCECTVCVVYGGDCARSLAHEYTGPILSRWERRAGIRLGYGYKERQAEEVHS